MAGMVRRCVSIRWAVVGRGAVGGPTADTARKAMAAMKQEARNRDMGGSSEAGRIAGREHTLPVVCAATITTRRTILQHRPASPQGGRSGDVMCKAFLSSDLHRIPAAVASSGTLVASTCYT